MLNPKQEAFCEEWVIHHNGTKAAISAGYSKRTANEQAARLLTNVSVKARISELQAEIAERNKLRADDVVQELRALAFWSINDFVGNSNTIRDISKLSREISKPVVGIKKKVETNEFGVTETTELKFADKRGALVDLGRHLGIFKEDNDQKNITIKVSRK
jgi:phage terminase small subunit